MQLQIGTRVYNNGDMANSAHFGTITNTRGGTRGEVEITPDPESDRVNPYWVPTFLFSDTYAGHGGTRFVTVAAYQAWRDEVLSKLARGRQRPGNTE